MVVVFTLNVSNGGVRDKNVSMDCRGARNSLLSRGRVISRRPWLSAQLWICSHYFWALRLSLRFWLTTELTKTKLNPLARISSEESLSKPCSSRDSLQLQHAQLYTSRDSCTTKLRDKVAGVTSGWAYDGNVLRQRLSIITRTDCVWDVHYKRCRQLRLPSLLLLITVVDQAMPSLHASLNLWRPTTEYRFAPLLAA